MKPAIRVTNLSKHYSIGRDKSGYRTLRESVMETVGASVRHIRRLFSPAQPAFDTESATDFWALRDVSFDVGAGEVVGIIGLNGAGKSTLLKILSRIVEPTFGRAEMRGRLGSLLEVGTGFHPELTGRENIYMNGSILGMSRREIHKKFDEIVEFSEVEQFLDTPVKRYSSGMYVRLAFAVAAHLEPEILVVDEVLAVGDQAFQSKCLGKLGDVSREGRTVLFVSHNMAAILNLCQKVALLQEGRLAFVGACKEGVELYTAHCGTVSGCESDLAAHAGRRDGSHPYLRKIRILNQSGVATDQVLCGEAMTLELEADSGELDKALLDFAITVEDSFGSKLTTVATHLSESGAFLLEGRGLVTCRLEGLPLAPGKYFLSLAVGVAREGIIDSIERAASFTVLSADYYGNGQNPNPRHGAVLARSAWHLDRL